MTADPKRFILGTPRLTLAEFTLEDLDRLAELVSEPAAVRYIGDGEPASYAQARNWLERTLANYRKSGFGYWRLDLRGTGKCIGWCGPTPITVEGVVETQLGYLLAPDHWGKGYATEASLATRDHAFASLGVTRLVALIDCGNHRSKRVAARVGMTYERDVAFSSSWKPLPRDFELFSVSVTRE